MAVAITRVVNACVLVEHGDDAVLTDPYFESHWFMRMREAIGLSVEALPRLSAIVGGHSVFDHWQPGSLAGYPFKRETPVLVATRSMRNKALAAGFTDVEVAPWNAQRRVSKSLVIEVAPAQRVTGLDVNNYVFDFGGERVFFGGEARDLDPLRAYRATRAPTDIALLPIDGSTLFRKKLVMNGHDALEATRVLGARTLVPIHYAMKPIHPLLGTPYSEATLRTLASDVHDLDVVFLKPGERRTF